MKYASLVLSFILCYGLTWAQQDSVLLAQLEKSYQGLGILYSHQGEPFNGKAYARDSETKDVYEWYIKNGLIQRQLGWYASGGKKRDFHFTNGVLDGKVLLWFHNGQKYLEEQYTNGLLHGWQRGWNSDGSLRFEEQVFYGVKMERKEYKKKNKILFVTTNVDEMNGMPNGTYLMELAIPLDYFVTKGMVVDIVSPKGGEIPLYHKGDTTTVLKEIIHQDFFIEKTKHSFSPDFIKADEYIAVIIPGGYGQFWDVHKNGKIHKIIAAIYESGGVIGALGHGTSTLVHVQLKSGEFLVKGKTLTSFPSWNEKNIMKESNYGAILPFDMEVELKKIGAHLKVYNHDLRENHEIVDIENRIVTAAFASGGEFIASEVYKLIVGKD